jgi:hypothetical protein
MILSEITVDIDRRLPVGFNWALVLLLPQLSFGQDSPR